MTTISVVIPTYNRASIVGHAIESVLEQTSLADEIIVVDDGSTDDTKVEIETFGERIRYVYQKKSGRTVGEEYGHQVECQRMGRVPRFRRSLASRET